MTWYVLVPQWMMMVQLQADTSLKDSDLLVYRLLQVFWNATKVAHSPNHDAMRR